MSNKGRFSDTPKFQFPKFREASIFYVGMVVTKKDLIYEPALSNLAQKIDHPVICRLFREWDVFCSQSK